ncbi:pyrroline-5-carboxylate reductase [Kibdelosporangium aridum]|uniref:Pyrroline-5-carboxylate reductase n=1 Tax=Kibdelosporangium aridum TaxID=2030 RepID=A0A428YJL6_KIBAR|nr:NAD(P)-binding domain-containing protein [Kibdelosporangium aridum]RSM67746.1 pyrroline-5-carboxylate reductase [Kibdelosporangium aridum]
MHAAYGFVGAGAITAAIVEGLSANVAEPPAVFLSPRSQSVGQELASRFRNVQVCGSNQEVLASTTSIVLAVRPQIARDVLAELTFRPEHVVISALAGVKLAQLTAWTAPAEQLVRVIPLPSAAGGDSLTVMHPDNAVARDLFGRVGGLVVPGEETTLDVFSASTATFAAHLDYLATIARWLSDHGVEEGDATAYVRHVFGQLGQSLLHRSVSFATLTDEHMTPGGINEQVLTDLRRDGVPALVRQALDQVLARLRT